MKKTVQWCCALALAASIPAVCAAQAGKPPAGDSQGAKEARNKRDALAEKQKQIFEEKNIPVETPEARSTTLIDLPPDEADAPGAVEK